MIFLNPVMFTLLIWLVAIIIVGCIYSVIADKLWGDDWDG